MTDLAFSLGAGAGLGRVVKSSTDLMKAGSKSAKTMNVVKAAENVHKPANLPTSFAKIGVSVYKTNKERNKSSKIKKGK